MDAWLLRSMLDPSGHTKILLQGMWLGKTCDVDQCPRKQVPPNAMIRSKHAKKNWDGHHKISPNKREYDTPNKDLRLV